MTALTDLKKLANQLRRDVLKMTTAAGSGHPTSCLSSAEIVSTLFFNEMAFNTSNPSDLDNDEFVLSKGHAAPILYAALSRAGCISDKLEALRKFNSNLEGHPIPKSLPWAKVATGSLGQGMANGVGMALAAKKLQKNYRTYVLMGDGECAEGSVYEALASAVYFKLDNLCAIVDLNRLGQSGETMLENGASSLAARFSAFGCNAIIIDGHSIEELLSAFAKARKAKGRPTVILAKTSKGKGISFLENKVGWHGKSLNKEELENALKEIPEEKAAVEIKKPEKTITVKSKKSKIKIASEYDIGDQISTREACGNALVKIVEQHWKVIVLDADVKNSTFTDKVFKQFPQNFIECFIAEQNMIGIATGLSVKGFNVFSSTFSAFLTRAHDQIRMAGISTAPMTICGSHCGVSIGEDGSSQMGLEDIAMFRSIPNCANIFYPSDAVSAEKLVGLAANSNATSKSMTYIRTTRGKTPVIYSNNEKFEIGGFKSVKRGKNDCVLIVAAGITLHEALKAYKELEAMKISVAIVDLYSVKPLNSKKLAELAKSSGSRILVVEDHFPQGGIGEAVFSQLKNEKLSFAHLAVRKPPHSGKPDELLAFEEINANAIIREVKKLAKV